MGIILNISALIILLMLVSKKTDCHLTVNNTRCDKQTESLMDTLASKLLVIGHNNSKFPENEQQLREYCKDLDIFFHSVKIYVNYCTPKFSRDAFDLLYTSFSKEWNIICNQIRGLSRSPRAWDLMNYAKCANSALDDFRKCNDHLIWALVSITRAQNNRQKIPMACCNFYKYRECLRKEAEDEKECTKTTVDNIDDYIVGRVLDDFLDSLCVQYDSVSNPKCKPFLSSPPKRNNSDLKPKSMINPFLSIVSSVADSHTLKK